MIILNDKNLEKIISEKNILEKKMKNFENINYGLIKKIEEKNILVLNLNKNFENQKLSIFELEKKIQMKNNKILILEKNLKARKNEFLELIKNYDLKNMEFLDLEKNKVNLEKNLEMKNNEILRLKKNLDLEKKKKINLENKKIKNFEKENISIINKLTKLEKKEEKLNLENIELKNNLEILNENSEGQNKYLNKLKKNESDLEKEIKRKNLEILEKSEIIQNYKEMKLKYRSKIIRRKKKIKKIEKKNISLISFIKVSKCQNYEIEKNRDQKNTKFLLYRQLSKKIPFLVNLEIIEFEKFFQNKIKKFSKNLRKKQILFKIKNICEIIRKNVKNFKEEKDSRIFLLNLTKNLYKKKFKDLEEEISKKVFYLFRGFSEQKQDLNWRSKIFLIKKKLNFLKKKNYFSENFQKNYYELSGKIKRIKK